VQLASVVAPTPVSWTPNVSGGTTVGQSVCNITFFGTGNLRCQSEVYSTAYVNGDVVVVGAFTEACQPGTTQAVPCLAGTQVRRDDIFAYAAGTGLIDSNFVPVLNAGPAWSVLAGPANTVYVGGAFSTVYGRSHAGLVQLNVNPRVTRGASADGSLVKGFGGAVNGQVRDLALSPDGSALYVGGKFTSADGVSKFSSGGAVDALARLNATTGALDNSFAFTLGDPISGLAVQVEAMALAQNGGHLAIAGTALEVNGTLQPRVAVIDTGGTLGAGAHLSGWAAPILANNCSAEHDYVRGLDFSPDGTFLVTADTGYKSDGSTPYSACDAVARFDVNAANTPWRTKSPVNVAPSWIDYSGGDSFYSVAVAGGVVYAGGHNRWADNYCGNNYVCGPNAELVDGLSALDANSGIALAWWHPLTTRGHGAMYLSTFPSSTYDGQSAGLALGTDVANVAGTIHSEEALFPLALPASATAGGPIPSGMFNEDGGAVTSAPMCADDAGDSSTPETPVELNTCTNDAEQNWDVVPTGTTGTDTIEVNGSCLDTASDGTLLGTHVVLDNCDSGAATQEWTQGQGNTLINAGATAAGGTPICLADTGRSTTPGNPLQIWTCDGATSQVWPLPSAQAPPAPPATGEISSRNLQPSTQVACLDDTGNSEAPGNVVQLWTCSGDPEQNWTLEADGTIQINGHCLDTSDPSGTLLVVLNPCDGNPADADYLTQQWSVGAPYELINAAASTSTANPSNPAGAPWCLAEMNNDSTSGSGLQVVACHQWNDQIWKLPAV